jgi:hypothetical protein
VRNIIALVLVLAAGGAGPGPAVAQVRAGIRAGASLSSALVRDSITETLSVTPRPGMSLTLSLDAPISETYRVEVAFSSSWSRLVERSAGDSRTVVDLAVWHPRLVLEWRLTRDLRLRGSAGALLYRPRHTGGNLFQQGLPIIPVLGAGVGFERPLAGGFHLTADAAWTIHRFTTTSLRAAGFVGERPVQRATVSAGLKREW